MTPIAATQKPGRRLDPEDAELALSRVQDLLRRQHVIEDLVHRQEEGDDRAALVEKVVQRQHDAELHDFLKGLHPADIAFILEALPRAERQHVWQLVQAEHDGEVLLEVGDGVRQSLLDVMTHADLVAALENLDADELADLAPELPEDVVSEVRQGLTEQERARLSTAMSYPEDTVGAVMDFDMVRVRDDVSLEVVLRYLRRLQELPDHTDQIFVVDRNERLQGTLYLTRILTREPDALVADIMDSDMLTLHPMDEADDAARAFERYDLVTAPVVDDQGRLVGRLSVTEVLDVIREASDEQVLSQAGLQEEDIFAPVLRSVSNRAPWLLLNLGTAACASFVASRFEDTVSHIVILAFLMSIVAGIAGNSGNQTMTMIIRSLATNRINPRNVRPLVERELLVTLLVGLSGSVIAAGFAVAISDSWSMGLVMMAAIVCNMMVGATVGITVPILRARFGKDPAIGSSVLLTFATDTLGFFIFLGLATVFLL